MVLDILFLLFLGEKSAKFVNSRIKPTNSLIKVDPENEKFRIGYATIRLTNPSYRCISVKIIFKNIIFIGFVLLLAGCNSSGGEAQEGLRVAENPMLRFFERKVGKILYLSLDGNLYTINQAGEEITQITQDGNLDPQSEDFRAYKYFAWSPDSENIAMFGRDADAYFVCTSLADGSNFVQQYTSAEGDPAYLAWAPNSEGISFLTNQWQIVGFEMQMHYLPIGNDLPAQTIGSGKDYYSAWGPGETPRFIAHVTSETEGEIRIISPTSGQDTALRLPAGTFETPAWSPDGDQLLMAIREKNAVENQLVITNLEGSIQTRLGDAGSSTAFGWSPNGKQVAYISSDRQWGGAMGTLTIQTVDAPDKKVIVDDPFIFAFFWAPDSKQIAYFTLDVAAGNVTSDTAEGISTLISLYMVDVKSGERKNLLSFYPTIPYMEVLERFDQYQHSATFWSPDSENFVISSRSEDGGGAVIVVVPVSGNIQPRPIANGWMAFWSPK